MKRGSTREEFLYLTTKGWKTGRDHVIEIWFVEHNGRHFVISERGKLAHWVQNIDREPSVKFRVGTELRRGFARVIEGESERDVATTVRKLMNSKYGWSQGLIVELTSQGVRDATASADLPA